MSEDNYDDDDEFIDDEMLEGAEADDDNNEVAAAAPAWIISMVVHGLIALVLAAIVFTQPPEEEEPPIRVTNIEAPPEEDEEQEEEVKLEEVDVTIEDEVESENPIVTDLDVPVEELDTEDPVEEEAVDPKGREEAVSTAEAGGAMAFMAIGAGGGASGAFGSRSGGGKKRAVGRNGGSKASESSVNLALIWFKKHQTVEGDAKGVWDVDGYMDNCQEAPKCEPGTANTKANGPGDTACTAYAVLCFLGAGYDHKTPGKFKATVAMGVDWLKANQREDGGFGRSGRNYENGVAAMAVCEAYAMSMDPSLKECAQKAIDNLLARQAKTDKYPYGLAWNYSAPAATRNDSSVSGWCIMALKAAKSGGLDVGNGWDGAKTWVDLAWQAANPGVNADDLGSESTSTFCYTYDAVADTMSGKKLECVGALCAIFLGKRPGDGMLDSLINTIMNEQIPQGYPCNTYYMYYNTLNIFQYGGEKWLDWNAQVRDMLVGAQHGKGTGCFNGSWDYEGTKFHGFETGRLLSTAYCCLSLEVYYRYERITKKK